MDALSPVSSRPRGDVIVYTYSSCDTCRRATRWLRDQHIEFLEKPIRESPPTRPELKRMLKAQSGQLTKLFNTGGRDYRDQDLKTKLPRLSEEEAFALLSANGNLVKRPFLIGANIGLVGFEEEGWAHAFAE